MSQKVQYGKIHADFRISDMKDMAEETPKPVKSVLINGFYYFCGLDGRLWQHDATETFPGTTTWNVQMWMDERYGTDPLNEDQPDVWDIERKNDVMTNFRALGALLVELDK